MDWEEACGWLSMRSPEARNFVAMNWNWEQDLRVLQFLVQQPDVDMGVATGIFWLTGATDEHAPVDAVVHLAAIPAPGMSTNAVTYANNSAATYNIFAAARAAGLVGCMVASFDAGLAAALGLDEKDLEPLLVCALGYPAPDERVVVEGAGPERGLAYWRERGDDAWVHHVPKLGLDDLLV